MAIGIYELMILAPICFFWIGAVLTVVILIRRKH